MDIERLRTKRNYYDSAYAKGRLDQIELDRTQRLLDQGYHYEQTGTGKVMVIFGLIFCCTLIGAIIGIPMIIKGLRDKELIR